MLRRSSLIYEAMNSAAVPDSPEPSGRVFCFKPCREEAEIKPLDPERPKTQAEFGIETCIFLDLNVLNRIHEAVTTPDGSQSGILRQEISELKSILSLEYLHTWPGIALDEARAEWLEKIQTSYLTFMQSEIPIFRIHPSATPPSTTIDRSGKYLSLCEAEQRHFGISYLCVLKMQEILLENPSLPPEQRFDEFLQYMDKEVDWVPRLEIEAAMHCFYQAPAGDHVLGAYSRKIKKNLIKGGNGDQRVDRALNAARDLTLIRTVSDIEGQKIDGFKQDAWILTLDAGLQALCAAVRFFPGPSGIARWMTETRFPLRESDSYWRHVDSAYRRVDIERSIRGAPPDYPTQENTDRAIRVCRELHLRMARVQN